MTPQEDRPTFRDCLALAGMIVRQTAGIAAQCVHVAGVETTAAAAGRLARAANLLIHTRRAMAARFQYTSSKPEPPARIEI